MADYLTRVAEAVRDATLNKAWQIGNNGPLRSAVDLQAVIASVPRPEMAAKYFAYDQEVGFDLYDTASEAKKAAQESVDEYRSEAAEGWNEAVENVCWGVVLGKTREIEFDDGYDGSAGLADCGRPVDYVLASEPAATQVAVPDGWKLVPVEPTDRMLDAMVRALSERGVIDADSIDADYAYRAMLAATSETPQTIQCNACDWIGSSADAHYLGGREPIGPLCPECHETTGPADDAATLEAPEPVLDRPASIGGTTFGVGIPVRTLVAAAQRRYEVEQTPASLADRQALIDALRRPVVDAEIATLRSAIRAMVAMLQAREWAEHVSADPDVTDLEVQITELVGTATKLREQSATLGEAISLQYANGEALAERVMQAEEQNATLVAAIKAIDDQASHAGDEFGGPLAVATKEGLGDRDELLELAGIADGYLESISLTAKQALSSVKGDK